MSSRPGSGVHGYRADVAFDGERELPDGVLVLVDGELIVGVEPGSAAAPADCPVTHLRGSTLLPGLIDAHVHLCGDSGDRALDQLPSLSDTDRDEIIHRALSAHVQSGVTAVRDLGDVDWAVADHRDTAPGQPHVVASGPPITSAGGHCANMGGEASGRDGLIRAVQQRAERGVDIVKIMASGGLMTVGTDVMASQFTLEELRLVVDQAHRQGLPITAHAHPVPAVRQAVEAGVDGIEHCTCFTAAGFHIPPQLAERIAASGIFVCPTLGRDPGVPVPPRIQAFLERMGLTWELRRPQIRAMYDAGVALIAGVDSGINPAKRHGVLPEAVIELVDTGASVSAALGGATSRAADACGLAGRTGRLRAGLAADLLIVDGNPFTDITALRTPVTVVARGVQAVSQA
ncbi:MAG TPA: amidohydrolase family protein [Jiangellaceae bacterium]